MTEDQIRGSPKRTSLTATSSSRTRKKSEETIGFGKSTAQQSRRVDTRVASKMGDELNGTTRIARDEYNRAVQTTEMGDELNHTTRIARDEYNRAI